MNILNFLIALVVLSLTHQIGISQDRPDFSKIDRWANSQKLLDTSLVAFTQQLIKPAANDLEKIRAIYQFVIHFLEYDRATYALDRRRVNQNVYDILERKKGICLDYAQLLCAMSTIAGLECQTITGFSKDLSRSHQVNAEPDHAWNLVQFDTNFYLLDPTWASNTLFTTDRFKEKYQADYFLTDPSLFITNHFPNLAMWQLLECPVSFQDFRYGKTDSLKENLCTFNYKDSIKLFNQLTHIDQKILEQASVYEYQPNGLNRSSWAHALIDKAVNLKESADELYQQNQLSQAIYLYQDALAQFELANQNTDLYRWQTEAWGFCHLNYAQALYKQVPDATVVSQVVDHLHQAKQQLQSLQTTSTMINHAIAQIDASLKLLR